MHSAPNRYVVRAFYAFARLPEYEAIQEPLRALCEARGVLGTILLAAEGINGTVSGQAADLDAVLESLRRVPGLGDLDFKQAFADQPPFHRLKVRLKREIVSIGDAEIDPTSRVGEYVDAADWNALLADPEVVVIDTRNDYEVRIGSFEGAVDPQIATFRDFPRWAKANLDPTKHRRVAMFCTGGIRCEKASSLLLREGFESVYHLRGGILTYLAQVESAQSAWQGECFVFDGRVAVDASLEPGSYALCYGCQEPVSEEERRSPQYEFGVCCARCCDNLDDATRQRRRERSRQVRLAQQRGEKHIGASFADGDADGTD